MKPCPYCAEEVQDAAVVCKHCKANLAGEAVSKVDKASSMKSTNVSGMNFLKIVGWSLLGILALVFWYVSIPILVAWFLFKKKKNKYSLKTNLIISGATLAVCIGSISAFMYTNRAPKLTLIEPQDQAMFQTKTATIKGMVDPSSSALTVNGQKVKPDSSGGFIYDAPLNDEKNIITVVATNGSNNQTQTLTLQRTFTPEELADRERQKVAAEQAQKDEIAKAAQEKAGEAKQALQKELDSLKKPFDSTTYRGSVANLMMETVLFNLWKLLVTTHKDSPDPEVRAMAAELEDKVSKLQIKEFPLMRKAYGEVVANGLWENDIDIQTSGAGNKTIGLTSAIFASNKNIAEAQRSIGEGLKLFRFTRVTYRWYNNASDYQYFTIESKADGEVTEPGK